MSDRTNDRVASLGAPMWRSWLGAAAIAVGALALRWPQMTESIWYDEYCRTKAHLNAASLWKILGHDVHNPLYNAVMFCWTAVFGDSEVSIRVPSLIAGMGSLAALAVWAGRRWGRMVGWFVGWLLAVSPVHVWYCGEAKNSMFVVATSVLSLIAVDRFRDGSRRWSWLLAVLACAAAIWTDFVTAFAVVPALGVLMSTPAAHRAERRRRWLALVAVAGLIAPLLVFKALNIADVWRNYLQPMTAYEAMRLLTGKLLFGDTLFPNETQRGYVSFALAVPVGLMIWFGCRRLWRDRAGVSVVLAFALPIPLIWIASEVIQAIRPGPERFIYQPRNVLVMFCPFMLVLIAGIVALPARWVRTSALGLLLVTQLVGSLLMHTLYRDRATVMNPNPHWREIAADIRATGLLTSETGSTREPVLISMSPAYPLRHYLGTGKVVWLHDAAESNVRVASVVAEHRGSPCLYIDDQNWSALQEVDTAQIESGFEMRPISTRALVRVFLLVPR